MLTWGHIGLCRESSSCQSPSVPVNPRLGVCIVICWQAPIYPATQPYHQEWGGERSMWVSIDCFQFVFVHSGFSLSSHVSHQISYLTAFFVDFMSKQSKSGIHFNNFYLKFFNYFICYKIVYDWISAILTYNVCHPSPVHISSHQCP